MNVIAFPTAARRLPVQDNSQVDRSASYDALMVYRLGLGRPWLDMLGHDDQARIAAAVMARDFTSKSEGK